MTTIKPFKFIAFFFFLAIFTSSWSQSFNDAATTYNEGIGLMKTDIPTAIVSLEKCIQICDQVGDSAVSIKEKATVLLADLYFQKAYKLYATDKKPNEALQASKEALAVAEKYSVEKTKEKTLKFMTQLYGIMGSAYFKEKAYDKAIVAFDSAIIINPDNTSALYNKALVYKAQDDVVLFEKNIDLFIVKMNQANDTAQVAKANKLALEYFRITGNKANTANKLNDAISLLNTCFKYGIDSDVFYALANIYNKQKKYDEALINADKGLLLATGTPEVKAKFYYEMAVAQAGKGLNDEACQSFTNAKFGLFLEASKAQMKNLKCK